VSEDPAEPSGAVARGSAAEAWDVAALAAVCLPDAWSADGFASELARPEARLWTAREDGRLVGYLVARRVLDELHVHSLAVDAARRRHGIASALLAQALAAESGLAAVLLEVRAGAEAARAFYAARGFVAVGRRPRYYADGEDAILMTRGS
jgi:ribosomal-protein-alanine acetyltransferase